MKANLEITKAFSPTIYPNKEIRYAVDSSGNIHRFEGTNGLFHWNGSTGDTRNPLAQELIQIDIRRTLQGR